MDERKNKYEEKTTQIEPIYDGKVISLQLEHVSLPNGNTSIREVVKHPGAVAVLAIVDNKMLVVHQYRKALERSIIEIPAGKIDPGEALEKAAKRELEEETGFIAQSLTLISSFYTSPGFADEKIYVYFTDEVLSGEMDLDDDEFLDCDQITLQQAKQYIADGDIQDAKTIFAVYAWEKYILTGTLT
ncbi:NUDIX hydrolase [Longirhabdus pacifica]|uniref:NUDIX hydrolase n=1 Tax=Longirhabdus pacifica TaxID=2305227 RepID=UPI001F0BAB82|nr:NUDIX hydrolase [Longirhabdus pacifica]